MIVPILKKGDSCSYHRLELPFRHLGLLRPEFETEQLESLLSKASVVVFNRVVDSDIIHLLRARKKWGFKICVDVDDAWQLYEGHVAYKGWIGWNMEQRIKESIMNADYVTTTTERLAEKIRPLNKNVLVLPNALPFGEGQFVNDRVAGDRVRFISAGGVTHLRDLKEIQNCFRKLERMDKGKYEMVLAGYDEFDKSGVWEKIEAVVKGGSKDYTRVYRLPLEMYMNAFNNGDVVLAPLERNTFNQFKSVLRIVEAGCKEMPIITSDWPPYCDEPTDLVMRATTTNQWYNHLSYCIKNPAFVKERGEALGAYVREKYDLRKINLLRTQLFQQLIS